MDAKLALVERDKPGASSPTLCRLENRADRSVAVAFHELLVEQFIASFAEPPTELLLDFDATDDAVHGKQEGRFFHGYYGHYCFLPIYVTCPRSTAGQAAAAAMAAGADCLSRGQRVLPLADVAFV